MSFNVFEFVQLDPNWLQSSTAKVLKRKFGVPGLVVFPAVLALAGRMVGVSSKFAFHISDLTEATGIEEPTLVAMLTEWAESSKRRRDGFRFGWHSEQDGSAWIDWPEFVDRHRSVISKRKNGAKGGRGKAGDAQPEGEPEPPQPDPDTPPEKKPNGNRTGTDEEPNGNRRPPHSRVEDSRVEEYPPTPQGGDGATGQRPTAPPTPSRLEAPQAELDGTCLTEATYSLADLERITGTLDERERSRAAKKLALVIRDIARAGITNPGGYLRRGLANWPTDGERSLGLVLQKLHGHILGAKGRAGSSNASPATTRLAVAPEADPETQEKRRRAGAELVAKIAGDSRG